MPMLTVPTATVIGNLTLMPVSNKLSRSTKHPIVYTILLTGLAFTALALISLFSITYLGVKSILA